MMMKQNIFAGLPYDISSVSHIRLLAYLLLLLLGNSASGIPASQLLLKQNCFVLLRAGWRRWVWSALCRCFCTVLSVCAVLLLIGLLNYLEWKTLWAWLLFTLHMEMIASVQVLLMALFENVAAAMLPVIFFQLVSLFLSNPIPGKLTLLLPGNWGALARSAEYENPGAYGIFHGGFPLWAAFALNAAVLFLIARFGWRLVRRKRLKQ
ncbi:MAG: hypothetical protein II885_18210 [Oscillospiraceae bacterium]|nr:hypothetical protein [Oscillospiraceae bacterium]